MCCEKMSTKLCSLCFLLYHAGCLKSYSQGNQSCEVSTTRVGLWTKYKCWYLKKDVGRGVSFKLNVSL